MLRRSIQRLRHIARGASLSNENLSGIIHYSLCKCRPNKNGVIANPQKSRSRCAISRRSAGLKRQRRPPARQVGEKEQAMKSPTNRVAVCAAAAIGTVGVLVPISADRKSTRL